MPVTLPAHAAAVLPFVGRFRLHATALVVGAAAPDLAYLAETGRFSHTLPGVFLVCLPVGLVAVVYAEALLLPALRLSAVDVRGVNWARLLRSAGLPRGATGWALAAISVLIGAVTHVLWDGFTHRGMMPASLYQDVRFELGSFGMTAPRWLQHLSTFGGTAIVLAYLVRRYERERPEPQGSRRAFWVLLVPTLLFALLGMAWRLKEPLWGGTLYTKLWKLFWPAASFGLAALSLAALYVTGKFKRR